MARFPKNTREQTWRHFREHVLNRRFLARNVIVLLVLLAALAYQGDPWWYYVLAALLYPALLLTFELIIASFWRDE